MADKINRSLLTEREIKRIERATGGKIVATVTDEQIINIIGTPEYMQEGPPRKSIISSLTDSIVGLFKR
ncbi:MAG: hypothetical protein ACFFC7_06555 [Candidatus Hermodarchaeota archaeon]